jgi:hypothetical protein
MLANWSRCRHVFGVRTVLTPRLLGCILPANAVNDLISRAVPILTPACTYSLFVCVGECDLPFCPRLYSMRSLYGTEPSRASHPSFTARAPLDQLYVENADTSVGRLHHLKVLQSVFSVIAAEATRLKVTFQMSAATARRSD